MGCILAWLKLYPPEERDRATLRNADMLLGQRIAIIEKDYADHAHSDVAMGHLRDAFEADRVELVAMRERVQAALRAGAP
jgi:nuclear transport factor 2 (NTF2) superfamily protein